MQPFIKELAHFVEDRWQPTSYDLLKLPDIAARALETIDPSRCTSLNQFIHDALFATGPVPVAKRHGNPSVIAAFSGQYFDIYVHFVTDHVLSTHNHSWSGAFQVIQGRSLNTCYRFAETHRIRRDLVIGQLETTGMAVFEPGTVEPIPPGSGLIHNVSYLGPWGFSISIRSTRAESDLKDYLRPGVAHEANELKLQYQPYLRLLGFLYRSDMGQFEQTLIKLLQTKDLATCFYILLEATRTALYIPASVFDAAQAKFGEVFTVLRTSLHDVVRQMQIGEARMEVNDPDLRFFLSALYACSHRWEIMDLIERVYPQQDLAQLLGQWLTALLIDAETLAGEVPAYVPAFLSRTALGEPTASVATDLTAEFGHLEDFAEHLEFLRSALTEIGQSPVYGSLYGTAQQLIGA